ncbi:NAD(P)-binding domain-containing protein [Streptomyces sp. NPDC001795]|uniref:NAD(P)-binding domain-containing protein n=1 Tax=Streptomyces sp. NPDC001795 TaxID=3154525 RepID=UPI00332AF6DF
MTTAIVGVGNIGSALARHLVAGGESVVLAGKGASRVEELADELGPLAQAASGAGCDRGRGHGRVRDLAGRHEGADPAGRTPAGRQGRDRPVEPDRVRREGPGRAVAARGAVGRVGGRRPTAQERPLRQGVRHPRRSGRRSST